MRPYAYLLRDGSGGTYITSARTQRLALAELQAFYGARLATCTVLQSQKRPEKSSGL